MSRSLRVAKWYGVVPVTTGLLIQFHAILVFLLPRRFIYYRPLQRAWNLVLFWLIGLMIRYESVRFVQLEAFL